MYHQSDMLHLQRVHEIKQQYTLNGIMLQRNKINKIFRVHLLQLCYERDSNAINIQSV